MPESLHLRAHVRARLEAGPFGPFVVPYVEELYAEGYAPTVVRRHVRGIDVFGQWLSRRGFGVAAVDEAMLDRFAHGFPRRRSPSRPGGRRTELLGGVARFVVFLRARGVVARALAPRSGSATDRFLASYDAHLVSVCGLSPVSRRTYLRYARAFCDAMFGDAEPQWSQVGPQDVTRFVLLQAGRLAPSGCRLPVTATRALLRYLALEGAVDDGLRAAVPTVRQWKHGSLPAHLTCEQVERVLAACAGDTLVRRRDHAILLLLARLGLRASEVAGLGLHDVDWRRGRLLIRSGKTDRPRILPLPVDAGEALARYVREVRPAGRDERMIFQRCLPPPGPLTAGAVGCVARSALRRARVAVPYQGSHVFRHTVATQMVRGGASFKEVADVLGHARLETTGIYAKLDLDALGGVALPWVGGAR